MFQLQISILLVTMLWSFGAFASNRCGHLFKARKVYEVEHLLVPTHRMEKSLTRQSIAMGDAIIQKVKLFYEAKDKNRPVEKLIKEINSDLEQLVTHISNELAAKGIPNNVVPASETWPGESSFKWSYIQPTPQGSHWLNRISGSLNRRYKIPLFIDPVGFLFTDASGMFIGYEKSPSLLLPPAVAKMPRPDQTTLHEIIHAVLFAERQGTVPSSGWPVHIWVGSKAGIDPESKEYLPYNHSLHFEEILTFGYNTSLFARTLARLQAERDQAENGFKVQKDDLIHWVKRYTQVSKNARIAAQRALGLISTAEVHLLKGDSQHNLSIVSEAESLTIEVFIPTQHLKDPKSYAIKELERGLEFAQLNELYFEGYKDLTDAEFITRAVNLRSAQKRFRDDLQ